MKFGTPRRLGYHGERQHKTVQCLRLRYIITDRLYQVVIIRANLVENKRKRDCTRTNTLPTACTPTETAAAVVSASHHRRPPFSQPHATCVAHLESPGVPLNLPERMALDARARHIVPDPRVLGLRLDVYIEGGS